jgi:hypothetical protein
MMLHQDPCFAFQDCIENNAHCHAIQNSQMMAFSTGFLFVNAIDMFLLGFFGS